MTKFDTATAFGAEVSAVPVPRFPSQAVWILDILELKDPVAGAIEFRTRPPSGATRWHHPRTAVYMSPEEVQGKTVDRRCGLVVRRRALRDAENTLSELNTPLTLV